MQPEDLNGLLLLRRFVEVAHHIPGRIRLRFASNLIAALSKQKLSALDKLCSADGCLRSYTLNTSTASLVLEYQPDLLEPASLDRLFGADEAAARQALEQLYIALSR